MRATFVLLLLVATHIVSFCSVASAGESAEVKNLQTDASNTAIHRNLNSGEKTITVHDAMEEERGFKFLDKLIGFFRSKPALGKQVENLQKDPKVTTSLQKASLSDKVIKNLKSYFGRLKANSTPIERGVLIATIVIFIAGMWLILAL